MGRLTHRTAPGWTYFVTTKAWQSISVFHVKEISDIVIAKLLEYREKKNYLLHEFVLMPNHLHFLITPTESVTLEKAMQLIKGGSSHEIHRVRDSHQQIWQSGFHESRIKDSNEYKNKADYIRFNPVTAKLVQNPGEWLYTSANGKFTLDPIPQGLKPFMAQALNVGPKGPTPSVPATPGLKPRPPKEQSMRPSEEQAPIRPPKEQHA